MGGSIVIDWRRKRVKELDRLMCSSRRGLRTKVKGHPLYDAIFCKNRTRYATTPNIPVPFPTGRPVTYFGGGANLKLLSKFAG